MKERLPAYGGQAVIEGVLMRGKKSIAMACRNPEGNIEIVQENLTGIYKKDFYKIPFLRGLISLWDSMGIGIRYLTQSANIQTGEEEKIEGASLFFTALVSILIGVGIFFLLPAAISGWIEKNSQLFYIWINLIEGAIRLILLIGYLLLVGQMKDIKRTFSYHGAEHKTINAFEAGIDLTPELVGKQSRVHPRCGTSFILTLVVVSILIFSAFPEMPMIWRLISRLLMIPLVAAISYEYIRFLALHMDNPFIKFISKPNLALQNLTTREPDIEMLEVSIAAFNSMYQKETT